MNVVLIRTPYEHVVGLQIGSFQINGEQTFSEELYHYIIREIILLTNLVLDVIGLLQIQLFFLNQDAAPHLFSAKFVFGVVEFNKHSYQKCLRRHRLYRSTALYVIQKLSGCKVFLLSSFKFNRIIIHIFISVAKQFSASLT